MILGLRTVAYGAPDLARGKAWYAKVLGVEPYFDQPFYCGFNVGGFELGLVPDMPAGKGGPVAYWGVPDAKAAVERLRGMGAPVLDPVKDVGEGILVAVVEDPFGNPFGIIENRHFDPKSVK